MFYTQMWPKVFEPDDFFCVVCRHVLGMSIPVPGSRGSTWFLCAAGIQRVMTKIKPCHNKQCGARHSFRDWRSGTY